MGPCSSACCTMDSQPASVVTSAEIVANGADCFQSRATPMTFAPAARNSWHTAVPNPPLAPVIKTFIGSLYIQSDGAHELEGVATLDDARAQVVVEMDFAVLDVIFEVDVAGALA